MVGMGIGMGMTTDTPGYTHTDAYGATIAPIILASDKTELLRFKGDKTAWPVYLSIGNISKGVRHQPARYGSVLVGYLPVSKLHTFENNLVTEYHLFHYCMKWLVEPLVAAGQEGVEMVCADGMIQWVYPLLAAFIGDHPECYAKGNCRLGRRPQWSDLREVLTKRRNVLRNDKARQRRLRVSQGKTWT